LSAIARDVIVGDATRQATVRPDLEVGGVLEGQEGFILPPLGGGGRRFILNKRSERLPSTQYQARCTLNATNCRHAEQTCPAGTLHEECRARVGRTPGLLPRLNRNAAALGPSIVSLNTNKSSSYMGLFLRARVSKAQSKEYGPPPRSSQSK